MGIDVGNNVRTKEFLDLANVQYAIRNIVPHMSGRTLTAYHHESHPHSVSLAIECGSHTDERGRHIAIDNSLRFLSFFDMISHYTCTYGKVQWIEIIDCFHTPCIGSVEYIYTSNPQSFDEVSPKTHIANLAMERIYSPDESALILMPSKESHFIGDELMYFARKV